MPDILMRLGRQVLVLDGAMGTMLQRAGIAAGECPELLNVTAPDVVEQIIGLYHMAGSDCAITNTFGGSAPKLAEYRLEDRVAELNVAGVHIARATGTTHILADMGPTGLVMEPLGPATFDEVFDAFAEQAKALASAGPDAIFIETMTDIAEARCAVLAARSVCDLPVFASVTMGLGGVMDLSGTPPEVAAVVLEAAGADAVGINCGLGPEQMLPLIERMVRATRLPVIAQPNAGMPRLNESGKTVFPGTPDEMSAFAVAACAAGAAAVGSCCGSTPAFTGAIYGAVSGAAVAEIADRGFSATVVAGPRRLLEFGPGLPPRAVGERINPTGKPELRASLTEGSMSLVRSFAAAQQAAGADLLDVNVGAPGVDATVALPAAVLALVATTDLPLVLDTTDPQALEAALRIYPGKAFINSVNGDPASMEAVLPLARRYGAALVVLALDDVGIPEDAAGRLAIAEKVAARAAELGIGQRDLVVDALTMTAATDPEAPKTTIEAVRGARERGFATALGVSNVSHGMPDRPVLNAAFLSAAVAAGLDAAIVNPNDQPVMEALRLGAATREAGETSETLDEALRVWDAVYAEAAVRAAGGAGVRDAAAEGEASGEAAALDPQEALVAAVLRGDAEVTPALADAVIEAGTAPESVIGDVLTPAIQRLGDDFGRGEVFLPQLIVAAEAMKAAVVRIKERLPEGTPGAGRVAFATVKGDIHSIGKDICVSLLESQGIEVEDLGVDVTTERVLEVADSVDVVCLSALMTTTLPAMEETARAVREKSGLPVFVGGAVVTADWAESIGAQYSPDAAGCVAAVSEAIAKRRQAL